jgi:uncharacterized protein
MSAPAGHLFRGPPAYQSCSPWPPFQALALVAAVEGLRLLGSRLLPDVGGVDVLPALAIFQAFAIALILTASGLRGGRPLDVLALHAPARGWRSYGAAIIVMLMLRLLTSALLFSVLALSPDGFGLAADWQHFQHLLQSPNLPLLIGVLAIGAPVSEELVYRGFLLAALARTRLGFWGGAVIVTVLWTALHDYSAIGIANVFSTGLGLTWVLWRTGSLRVAIFCHALNNLLAVLAFRLIALPTPP